MPNPAAPGLQGEDGAGCLHAAGRPSTTRLPPITDTQSKRAKVYLCGPRVVLGPFTSVVWSSQAFAPHSANVRNGVWRDIYCKLTTSC